MRAIATIATLAVLSLTAASASVRSAKAGDPDSLVVHEWGTFTSIAGEDGRAVEWFPLDGQRDLPCFVERYDFGKSGLAATVRMETPVLYFYARQPTTIDVSVRFRQGLITEWFPHAAVTPSKIGPSSLRTSGFWSTARWKGITVTPGASGQFPQESAASHYYAARKTDAAPLQLGSQQEKFLFYRGVGNFGVPLTATEAADGRVTVKSDGDDAQVGTVVLFENRNGKLGYDVRRSAESHITIAKPQLSRDITSLTSELRQILISHGLYEKEARAMIETWRDSWFEEGTRLFYIVPSGTVDDILPLAINPRPAAIARVFVGRLELLTRASLIEVQQALEKRDTATLLKYGRFLQPIVGRLFGRDTSREQWSQIHAALEPVYRARAGVSSCAPPRAPTQLPH